MRASKTHERAAALQVRSHAQPDGGLFSGLEPGALREPLRDILSSACERMAGLLAADVVSVYVRERGDDGDFLLMEGNIGLTTDVIGNLRLRVGEGIIGWVAECLRPISVGSADTDPRFKPVRGIGEEPYPVMVAQPVIRHGECLGVLALQRSAAKPFTDGEVQMAAVLAEAVGLVLEASGRYRSSASGHVGTEAVCLLGRPVSSGLGMGRVELIPTAESLATEERPTRGARNIERALARVEKDLVRLRSRLSSSPMDPVVERALARMELLLSDGRLRERALAEPAG